MLIYISVISDFDRSYDRVLTYMEFALIYNGV